MRHVSPLLIVVALSTFLVTTLASAQTSSAVTGLALELNLTAESGRAVHILPPPARFKALGALNNNGGTPPLLYKGGPVMTTATVYAIYWASPTLQDGSPTSLSAAYQTVQNNMLKEYFGHAIANNNTQYYQVVGGTKTYIKNSGRFGGSYVDTSPYPGKDCSDPAVPTPTNCISDTDLQNEISKVMGIKGWTGGVNKMFLLFTSSNEGQCLTSSTQCSYQVYCAYHSAFVNSSSQDVVYGNIPYGNTSVCQIPGAPSPNSNPAADVAATAASHELTEAITDPLGNAWFDSSGFEIGDECAYFYGFIGWDSAKANETWDGHPFLLQTEYSNYLSGWSISTSYPGCFNSGPEL
jgi:hypothetical protein